MATSTSTCAAAVAVAVADAGVTDDAGEPTPAPASAPTPAPAPAPLPFRPRVLALGRPQQQSLPQKRPAPSPAAVEPASAQAPATKAPSTLWRRHEHGSYRHYYFRRKPGSGAVGADGTDARLALLREEWFRGKAHLDIGTNTGKVAWEIYQRFGPARVLGVDIDPGLIETARTKLRHACRRDGVEHGEAVAFECRDFVGTEEEEEEGAGQQQCDVVTCLSVAKHVHLQGGDAALLRLFRRVHARLRPGGRFVLEPQPWRSYRKRKHASAESARHYASIRLRPPFTDVLLGPEVGFAAVEALGVPPGAADGYRRPLYCFVKAAEEA